MGNRGSVSQLGPRSAAVSSRHIATDVDSDDEIYPLFRQDRLLTAAQGEFKTEKQQKIALTLILVSEFFRYMAMHSLIYWIPITLQLNISFFSQGDSVNFSGFSKLSSVIGNIISVSYAVTFSCAWIIGIFADAFVKKSRLLLVACFCMFGGILYFSVLMFDIGENISCCDHNLTHFVNCTFAPVMTAGNISNEQLLTLYCCLVMYALSFLESVFETTLPVLAGDQLKYNNKSYTQMCQAWAAFLLLCAVTATATFLAVIFGKLTREPRADVSVIVDTVGIWKQAFMRCRYRKCGEGFLSTAKSSNEGDYANGAVDQRMHMLQFFCVILCLIPLGFSTQLPIAYVSNEQYNAMHPLVANATGNNFLRDEYQRIRTVLFCMLADRASSAIIIPLGYLASRWMQAKYARPISFLTRLTLGQISMILALMISMITSLIYNYDVSFRTLLAPSILLGICNALVYTVGYELTFVAAPRAMQSTSMGMFYSLDGISNLINLVLSDIYYNVTAYKIAGVVSTLTGMLLLIVIYKKIGLRLYN